MNIIYEVEINYTQIFRFKNGSDALTFAKLAKLGNEESYVRCEIITNKTHNIEDKENG